MDQQEEVGEVGEIVAVVVAVVVVVVEAQSVHPTQLGEQLQIVWPFLNVYCYELLFGNFHIAKDPQKYFYAPSDDFLCTTANEHGLDELLVQSFPRYFDHLHVMLQQLLWLVSDMEI